MSATAAGAATSANTAPTSGLSADAAAGRVQATPVVRRIAQELGVDLASFVGSGPGGRITEEDVRRRGLRRGGGTPRAAARRPARHRRAHGTRASRGAPRHLGRGVRLRERLLRAAPADGREGVRRVARRSSPSSTRASTATRSSTSTATTSASRCRRTTASSSPSSRTWTTRRSTSSARRSPSSPSVRAPDRSRRRSSAARRSRSRAPASSPVCSRRRSSTIPKSRSSASAGSRPARSCATARSSFVASAIVAITFDHRVVDGARAAAFGLAVIARVQSG